MLFTSNKILTRLTPIQLTKEQWDSNQRDVSIFSWASILRFWQLGHLQIGLYAQRSPSIESRYSKLSDIFEFWLMTCDLMARLMAIHVMIRRVGLSKTYVVASALFFFDKSYISWDTVSFLFTKLMPGLTISFKR